MLQLNILAESNRLLRLSEIGDKLEKVSNAPINWAKYEEILDEAIPNNANTSKGGRPPFNKLLLFKMCLLQSWYGLSDEQVEYQVNDRLSFQRFLGIDLSTKVPDKNTLWDFKEALDQSGADYDIFHTFVEDMEKLGIITHNGTIIDATFVDVPRQHYTPKENEQIKRGEIPENWSEKKKSHKDTDSRWAKKGNETHYGHKDHIKVDKDSKLIVDFEVTSANVHDSQCMVELIDEKDNEVWLDSAYIGEALEAEVREKNPNVILNICEKARINNPLTEEQKVNNREKSRVRARVEHVNGQMTMCGGLFIRCTTAFRAGTAICLKNIAYNISRFAFLATRKTAVA